MGILIPGKMPKQKSIFIEITPNGGVNEIINPLLSVSIGLATELPAHGDLIDRAEIDKVYYDDEAFENGVGWLFEYIDKLTPVIPAEGGADG